MTEEKTDNIQKGIRLNATFGQFLSVIFLIIVLFVLPIGGYEYLSGRYGNDKQEVYTAQTQNPGSSTGEGRVAGISTSKVQTSIESTGDTFEFLAGSTTLVIAIGIILLTIALTLSGSLIYDFCKK